jgi:Family of unknown function (DUF5985)
MTQFLISGALSMAYLVAAMFFLKFWSTSRDRLFALFACAFALLALQRIVLPYAPDDLNWLVYSVRLLAFVVIIIAIVDKNRAGA